MATEKKGKDLRANIPITKPIVYLDMDGVLCDFDLRHEELLKRGIPKDEAFDHPEAYLDLKPIPGAIEAYNELEKNFEVYILRVLSVAISEYTTDSELTATRLQLSHVIMPNSSCPSNAT